MSKSLVAKVVFGEITLGDVLNEFKKNIVALHIYSEDAGLDQIASGDQWWDTGSSLEVLGESFNLKTKVKIRDNSLEFSQAFCEYTLTLLGKLPLDSLLPKKSS